MLTGSSALVALSNDLAAAIESVAPSVVAVEARERTGSTGFFVRPHLILTADHALEDDDIEVVYADGETEIPTIAGRDPSTDLALLHTERAGVPVAHAAGDVRVGTIAIAVTRDDDGDVAATVGTISMVGRAWRTWQGGRLDRFVRPELAFSPRFSGSPLIDARGTVVGLNTAGLSRRDVIAIPSATLERVIDALATRGSIARGYLGVALQHVHLPEALGGGTGAVVVGVEPESPADRAGMIVGDVIVGIGGEREDIEGVHAAIAGSPVGSALGLDVVRGGAPQHVHVTVGERPEDDG
jgi:S1-C subfamily serine protease